MRLNGKKIDVITCKGLRRIFGLMFKSKDAQALLFEFKKPTSMSIHSFFCPEFLAVWLNDERIVDCRIVEPYLLSVKPKEKFTKLVEIPISERYVEVIKSCNSDENKKV